jgi:hypothetical protein
MMGDASDNIPGLPGVGDKTAKKFIAANVNCRLICVSSIVTAHVCYQYISTLTTSIVKGLHIQFIVLYADVYFITKSPPL